MERIYKRNQEDKKEVLNLIYQADTMEIEEMPAGTFTRKDGQVASYFNTWINGKKFLFSRSLVEWLEENDVINRAWEGLIINDTID